VQKQVAFYRLNAALASREQQKGPDVYFCIIVMGVQEDESRRHWRHVFSVYEKTNYLDPWQIDGIVYMSLTTLGYMPMLSAELKDHRSKPEVTKALADLMGLQLIQSNWDHKPCERLPEPKNSCESFDSAYPGRDCGRSRRDLENHPNPMFSVFLDDQESYNQRRKISQPRWYASDAGRIRII